MHRVRSFLFSAVLGACLCACGAPIATQPQHTAVASAQPLVAVSAEAAARPDASAAASPATVSVAEGPTPAPSRPDAPHNLDRCAGEYDPQLDYFPDKVEPEAAAGWKIEYHPNYKVITVLSPWQNAEQQFSYVLVQCGTPAPSDIGDAQLIEVPVKTVVAMSTTQLPHLAELDLVDRLVGVDNLARISTPAVAARAEAGELRELGGGAEVNVEQALELAPGLIMTYGVGDPQYDAHPKLLEAGLKVALNAEYLESSPLGQAEWIKFTATFFNREAAATVFFDQLAARYTGLARQARAATGKPTVMVGTPYQGTWFIPGGKSFPAQLLADAGAQYLWADDTSAGSLQLGFEAVYERAAEAEYWLNTDTWQSLDDGRAADARFGEFAAFKSGKVFNNDARVGAGGGNDYYETGVTRPDLVLADMIKIFHPELLPDHELFFYRQLAQ